MKEESVWDEYLKRKVAEAKPKTDVLNPTDSLRDLAISRVLQQAVEAWISGDHEATLRMATLAERYVTAPHSTFE